MSRGQAIADVALGPCDTRSGASAKPICRANLAAFTLPQRASARGEPPLILARNGPVGSSECHVVTVLEKCPGTVLNSQWGRRPAH